MTATLDALRTGHALVTAVTARTNLFQVFAWSDWKPHGADKMRSPGGRVLSKAAFDRLSAAGKGKGTAAKPAAKPAAGPKSPPPLGATRDDRLRALTAMSKPQLLALAKGHGVGIPAGAKAEWVRDVMASKLAPVMTNAVATPPASPAPAPPAFNPTRFGPAGPALSDPKAEYEKQDAAYVAAVKEFDAAMAGGRKPEQEAARGKVLDALFNRAEAAKALPDPPKPTQFELDRIRETIAARYGERPAGVLHAAAWALAKAAPLLAESGGAGAGAGVGAAVGSLAGPAGTGVGAAVGTVIGGLLGGKVGRYTGSPRRFLAGLRRFARQTLPAAAGTAGAIAGAPLAAAGVGMTASVTPAMLAVNAASGGAFLDGYFDAVSTLFAAPAKLARAVYRGTAGLVEGSAAKRRKLDGTTLSLPRRMSEGEGRDVVAEVKAMLAQAGVSPVPPDAVIRFAIGSAALAEDGWFDGDDAPHEAFMWQAQRTRRGHPKAVWAGAGQKEPLYGQDAVDALEAQGRRQTRTEAVKAGAKKVAQKVAAAAKKADAAVGKAAGKAGERFQVRRKAVGAKAKAMAVEGKFGTLVKWLAESQVGARLAVELERRAERVDATAKDMADMGYAKGQVEGGKRAFRYLASKFVRNRRRYGLIPALGIELAVFAIAKGIPVALTLGTAAAGAALGSTLGGAGLGAGALGGMVLGGAVAKRFLRMAVGPVYAHLGRAVAETGAAAVARRTRPASAARLRKRAGKAADLAPAAVGAMAEAHAPTVLDLVAAVKAELAARCRLAGVACPPVSDGRVLRALDRAADAVRLSAGG